MRTLWRILSSWWLTAALSAVGAAMYVVFGFLGDPWPRWTDMVMRTGPGAAMYLLTALNLMAASVRVIADRMREPVPSPDAVHAMDASKEVPGMTLDQAERWLRERGFASVRRAGAGLSARKGVWAFVPGTVLRVGIVITMLAALASAHMRRAEERAVHSGDKVTLLGREVRIVSVSAPLPADFLKLGEADVFTLPYVEVVAEAGGGRIAVGGGSPSVAGSVSLRVTHIGYTAELAPGAPAVDLDVLPPGKSDLVEMPGGEVLTATLVPGNVIRKGLLKGDSYDLGAPRISLKTQGAKDAVTVTPKYALYARLRAVVDPALPWLRAGLWLMLIGAASMLVRAFWFERAAMAALTPGGAMALGYQEEYYRKWGIYRFARWMDMIFKAGGEDAQG